MKKIGVICVMVISFLFIVSCTEKMSDESSDDLSEDMLSSELGNLSESELSYVLSDDQSSLTGQSYKFNSKRVRYLNNLQKRVKPYKITCTDSDKGADYQNVGYVTLKNYPKREIQKSDWCWRDGIKLQEYICEKGEYKGDTTFDCSSLGSDYVCEDGACVTSNVPKADILSIPLPENSHCFWGLNSDKPECLQFYTETCSPYSGCSVSSACPKYYNPVYDTQGTFYPSACWAEQLGIKNYEYGYSYKIQKFFRDIWRMKKVGSRAQYTTIETPNIEFSYSGSGLSGWKSGTFLRSTMWVNNTNYNVIDFNIDTESSGNRKQFEIETSYSKTWSSVYGEELDMLLVFLTFDDAYPTEVLLEWTETYEQLMNDYFASKQNLPNPIHYNIVPVVIEPPEGVHRIVPGNNHFSSAERELIYDTAVENIINPDFDVLVAAPIMINGFGGSYGFWNNLEFIHAPLSPKEPYSESDVDQGIHSLVAFHDLFLTISHEVLHAVGLRGDHVPMGYGTTYLAYVGQNTNSITGKEQHVPSKCDFYGSSSDVFAVELPEQLTIRVGEEPHMFGGNPSALRIETSRSGRCLFGSRGDVVLKDYDRDGTYEIMYTNNLIGPELQRTLGWVDVDGDGITELIDPTPYDGIEITTYDIRDYIVPEQDEDGPYAFEVINDAVSIEGCSFAHVRLETGQEGHIPLQCNTYNDLITNVYTGVKYYWFTIDSDKYGTVLIASVI